jgi:hypothetical protein
MLFNNARFRNAEYTKGMSKPKRKGAITNEPRFTILDNYFDGLKIVSRGFASSFSVKFYGFYISASHLWLPIAISGETGGGGV